MRIGSIVMLAAALVFGLAAAFLAKLWLETQAPEPAEARVRPDVPVNSVVVASRPLRFGMEVGPADLREIAWPEGAIPDGAFATIDEVMHGGGKRVVLSAIAAKEPLLREKITGPGQRASLSALVSEGRRAVTISVNEVLGVAGFVLPGERVDILLTREEGGEVPAQDGRKKAYTDVLLQNVRVLAIDQLADDRTADPEPAKTVTVEVAPEQAQKIALAASVGKLSLALRSAGYSRTDAATRISLADLRGGRSAPEAAAAGDDGRVSIIVTRVDKRQEYAVPRGKARVR